MAEPDSRAPIFELGLVMAGAISAGAYTAGVIDFLIEALNDFEAMKQDPAYDGPRHTVKLSVMAGASAGGMTAGMTALALHRPFAHVSTDGEPPVGQNLLYDSWVRDITAEKLLSTTDLTRAPDKPVPSLLCSDPIDVIIDKLFAPAPRAAPPVWLGARDGSALRLALATTSLVGLPYSLKLSGAPGGGATYTMRDHGEILWFDIDAGNGSRVTGGRVALDPFSTGDPLWQGFRSACAATGAFPFGLRPRLVERAAGSLQADPKYRVVDVFKPGAQPRSIMPSSVPTPHIFGAIDGGVVDNEPLEYARRHLSRGKPFGRNPRDGVEADASLILVDPFPYADPDPAPMSADEMSDLGLLAMAKRFFGLVTSQVRFKIEELTLAADETVFSRFAIYPARSRKQEKDFAIACGCLGGFGGFLHESFRRHDYLLGRRNAQAFLRRRLALPKTSWLFRGADGQAADFKTWFIQWNRGEREAGPATAFPLFREYADPATLSAVEGLPIIPLSPRLQEEIKIGPDNLPRVPPGLKSDIMMRTQARLDAVVSIFLQYEFGAIAKETPKLLRWRPTRSVMSQYVSSILLKRCDDVLQKELDAVVSSFRP